MNEPLRNTLSITGLVELTTLPLAVFVAILLARTDVSARRAIGMLLVPLLFLPLYLQATAWDAGFGRQGWLTYLADGAHEPWLSGIRAVVWIHTCAALPWATLFVSAGLRNVPRAWEELASLEAGPWRVLASVTLPRALPGIAAAALWIGVSTAGEMIVTDMYMVRTNAEAIFLDLAAGATLGELTWGAAGNLVVVGVLAAAAGGLAWLAVSPREPVERSDAPRWRLGAWRWPAGAFGLALVGLLWSAPLYNLLHHAGMEVRSDGARRVREWSGVKAARQIAAAPAEFSHEFGWSAQIGGLAACLAVAAATPLAWRARASRSAWVIGWSVAALSLAIPGPLVSLVLLTVRDGVDSNWLVRVFDESIGVVAAAHAWRAFPFTWLILSQSFREFPREEWEDAAVSGAGPWRAWWTVVLPRRKGTLLVAALVALGVSLAEVPVSHLVRPQGVTTVAVRAFELAHYGANDRLAGLSLLTVGLACLLTSVAWLATRWDWDRPAGRGALRVDFRSERSERV